MNLQSITRAVAHHLGDDWIAARGYHSRDAFLTCTDGARIHVRPGTTSSTRRRIELAGMFTDDEDRSRARRIRHQITVAPTKDPHKIAGDIRRRLLPAYVAELYVVRVRAAQHAERLRTQIALRDELTSTLPSAHHIAHGDVIRYGSYENGGEIKVLGADVTFSLRIPAALARPLAEHLANLTNLHDE